MTASGYIFYSGVFKTEEEGLNSFTIHADIDGETISTEAKQFAFI
jgi:hypothetical protein